MEQRRFIVGASQPCTHSSQVRLGKNDDGSPIYSIFDARELFPIFYFKGLYLSGSSQKQGIDQGTVRTTILAGVTLASAVFL